jgi:FtsZ-binding cell division protein ZapB
VNLVFESFDKTLKKIESSINLISLDQIYLEEFADDQDFLTNLTDTAQRWGRISD